MADFVAEEDQDSILWFGSTGASVCNDETGEIASHCRAGDTIMLPQDGDSLIWHINML